MFCLLVPVESRVRFTQSGTAVRFDISCQAGSYMYLHFRSGNDRERCFPAVQLRNLIPFASVSAENRIDSCIAVSADLHR